MKVFVTGATGWIGTVVVEELLAHGHSVLGLARSDGAAKQLKAAGAEAHRGSLEDVESLKAGAASADGAIHLAFDHDLSQFAAAGPKDRAAVEAIGGALAGSGGRPLVISSGTLLLAMGERESEPGEIATEDTLPGTGGLAAVRGPSETAALALAAQGVRSSIVRLPPTVHGDGDVGLMPRLVDGARSEGVSAYIGDGAVRWPAVHRRDAARLYRLALEKGAAGSRFHAVAEEGVPIRKVAELIGERLGMPVVSRGPEEVAYLGFLAGVISVDNPTSAKLTKERLGWEPTQPGLLEDMAEHYFKAGAKSNY